jgi:hypothetical protein
MNVDVRFLASKSLVSLVGPQDIDKPHRAIAKPRADCNSGVGRFDLDEKRAGEAGIAGVAV